MVRSFTVFACCCFQVVTEYERAVIFRLGRLRKGGSKGPGIFTVIPCIDTYKCVDLRTVSFDVPPQEASNLSFNKCNRPTTNNAMFKFRKKAQLLNRGISQESKVAVSAFASFATRAELINCSMLNNMYGHYTPNLKIELRDSVVNCLK